VIPAAAAPRTTRTTGAAQPLRRRCQDVVLLVHVARNADDEKLEPRRAGALEGFRLTHAQRDRIARLDRRGLAADGGGAVSVHHVVEPADTPFRCGTARG